MGSVNWNGNEVANALDLGLDLDLISAATTAAKPQTVSAAGRPVSLAARS
jgi:hypothetical protein